MSQFHTATPQSLPSYQDATSSSPPQHSHHPVERAPSPAPSYRTIPPENHKTLYNSSSAILDSTPLRRAALETPDAVLSRLNITNYGSGIPGSDASTGAKDGRLLVARTDPDGVERYHITFPSRSAKGTEMVPRSARISGSHEPGATQPTVPDMCIFCGPWWTRGSGKFKSSIQNAETERPIGQVRFNVSTNTAAQIVFEGGEELDISYEHFNAKRLPVELLVSGQRRLFYWVAQVREKSADEPAVFGIEPRRKKTSDLRLVDLRLIDAEMGWEYAVYVNEHSRRMERVNRMEGIKKPRWGHVQIKCRAVLLDDGLDQPFIMLLALLEAYMRMFGTDHTMAENLGLMAAVNACSVM